MAGRIVLFGATGYTGRLTAEAMVERGLRPVLAARSRDKLEALAGELGGELEIAVADVSDPPTVSALVERGDVLVTTVGPVCPLGGSGRRRGHYLGSALHRLDRRARVHPRGLRALRAGGRASGSAMLTAFGYDWVPGNLAGATALRTPATTRCAWTSATSSPARRR